MKEHTPTHKVTQLIIVPTDTSHVAFVNGPTVTREEALRAVNCHEELLKELKDAVADLEALYNHSKTYGKFEVSLGMFRRLAAMKEAIAKAEGK